jgi:hypothetical protein
MPRVASKTTGQIAKTSPRLKSVLRWGGLAGMIGGIVSILSAILGLAFWPPPPVGPCGPPCFIDVSVANFPAVKTATNLGYAAYLSALILFIFLFLALYQALRKGSFVPALFGSGMGMSGLVLMTAGCIPTVAFAHISDLYHAPGATPQDQATLVLVSHGVQAVFNETDTVGGIFLAIAFILLGTAMVRNITFGKRFGGVTIALGLLGLIGIALISIGQDMPGTDYAFVIFVTILPLLLGRKLYSLSRSS